jgi:hypothetical protein
MHAQERLTSGAMNAGEPTPPLRVRSASPIVFDSPKSMILRVSCRASWAVPSAGGPSVAPPPPPLPIGAPCTHCLRHGDPMHAQERLTAAATAAAATVPRPPNHHQVFGLEIAVHDPMPVQHREPGRQLSHQVACLHLCQRSTAVQVALARPAEHGPAFLSVERGVFCL